MSGEDRQHFPHLIKQTAILPRNSSTLLGPQSRFGDKLLQIWVVCPQNGTAVLKGLEDRHQTTTTGDHRTYGIHKETIQIAIFTNSIWFHLLWSAVIGLSVGQPAMNPWPRTFCLCLTCLLTHLLNFVQGDALSHHTCSTVFSCSHTYVTVKKVSRINIFFIGLCLSSDNA